jgi:hypothetical protein
MRRYCVKSYVQLIESISRRANFFKGPIFLMSNCDTVPWSESCTHELNFAATTRFAFQICSIRWCHSRVQHRDWLRSCICICRSKKPSLVANTASLSLVDMSFGGCSSQNLGLHRLRAYLGAIYRLLHAADLDPKVCIVTYRKQEHAEYDDHMP